MKTFDLSGVGGSETLIIKVGSGKKKAALLTGSLGEPCEFCGEPGCLYSCDESQGDERPNSETDPRVHYNLMTQGIESLLVALAARGYVMDDPKMIEAINDSVEACQNNAE